MIQITSKPTNVNISSQAPGAIASNQEVFVFEGDRANLARRYLYLRSLGDHLSVFVEEFDLHADWFALLTW